MKNKILAILLVLSLCLSMLPMSVFAAETEDYITVFDEKVSAGQYFAGSSANVVSVAPADNYLHYEGDGKITLKNFAHSDENSDSAILTDNKDVSLTLIGESELTNSNGDASVVVNNGKLQISGDGSLKGNGGISCSGFELSGGTITDNSVTSNGDISITGGELTLTSHALKAIGDNDISITGGKVTVSGNRYAIFATGDNGTVSITGGEVELTAVVSGSDGDKAIFAGTLTIDENMQILAGSSAADAAVVDSYNDEMYVKITQKDLIITGGTAGTDYTYENGVLDIKNAGTYEIKNVDPATATGDIIKVSAPSGTVNITLSGVVINVSATDLAAFEITGECTTKLILKDGSENSLDSGVDRAGIANHSHNLIITCENAENAPHICSSDCGVLRAIGQYYGAGIGGDSDESGSNITITGGNIVADIVNSQGGAGIGGGLGGNGSNITISGGTVTATSTGNGAGIGGGFNGSGNNITISGGTVTATSVHGAGIGGGRFAISDSITISGGTVTATSVHGAGIGGGADGGIAENIKIAPAANTRIYAYNGSDNTGTALTDSPFTTETNITRLLSGNAFYSEAEAYKLDAVVTKPPEAITGLKYNGERQNLVIAGEAEGGTMVYRLSSSYDWSAEIPTMELPGAYRVQYKVIGDSNHNDCEGGTVAVTIDKADQNAPAVGKTDETISNKKDGSITGASSTMEYRKEGDSTYTAINGDTVSNLAVGTYYVRLKGDDNYNPSPETEVIIRAGRKLTVIIPSAAEQIGYTLAVSETQLAWQGEFVLEYRLLDGYTETEDFAIKVNGKKITLTEGRCYLNDVETDIEIAVEGVADTTTPEAEISISTNRWTQFLNNITFGLFFKETQDVTITATDKGSGLDKIYYLISETKLTEEEVETIVDVFWTEYDAANKPSIAPDNKYIVYVKVTDNAGNIRCISSDGLVLDGTAPVISGIENGKTYYGQVVFTAKDTLAGMLKVEIDGVDKTHFEGQYVINPDNAEHTVVATDNAGNKTEYKITVYKVYEITFKHPTFELGFPVNYGVSFNEAHPDTAQDMVAAKDHHTFIGWYESTDGGETLKDTPYDFSAKVTGDVTLYPLFEIFTYTVTYKADGEVVGTVTVEHGKDATAPAIPEKEGYTQTAPVWDKDGKNITANTEINAVYTVNEYTITFMDENGVYKTVTVKHGEKVTMPEAPKKDGYTVTWEKEIGTVTEDVTVKAVYTEIPTTDKPSSPQTGDNSHMALWFALLLLSGGAVFAIAFYGKRKAEEN